MSFLANWNILSSRRIDAVSNFCCVELYNVILFSFFLYVASPEVGHPDWFLSLSGHAIDGTKCCIIDPLYITFLADNQLLKIQVISNISMIILKFN